MDSDELQAIAEIRENHRRRLLELEKKQALWGLSADPLIAIEIEDIRLKIEEIDKKTVKQYLGQANWTEAFNDIGKGATTIRELSERITALGQYIMFREDSIRREIAGLYKTIFDEREKDSTDRYNRQRRNDILFFSIIILLIIIVLFK